MKKSKINIKSKIAVTLCIGLLITVALSKTIFLSDTPRTNKKFIASIPAKTAAFFTQFMTSFKPTPTAVPIILITPLPTAKLQPSNTLPTAAAKPAKKLQPTPTKILTVPTSTPKPTPTKKPQPPQSNNTGCPTTSSQTFNSVRQGVNIKNKINFNLAANPETNLNLRGWTEINESKNLISRNGDNSGLDPNMPPQISTLFGSRYPQIIKTYIMNAWDYENGRNLPGQSATPAYRVHVLGLGATPGEPLYGLKAGRTIDGTNVFLVLYATPNYILMIHANEDSWDEYGPPGYPFYFMDICVDPNLVSAYERDNAAGRQQLPGIASGQIFGYAASDEVKFVIRDTMSFMDTRYKEDWWEYQ